MFDETKVLAALSAGDVLYAETFEEETASTQIQLESEKIEKLEKGVDSGVGLRVIRPWQTFFASTNSREESHLVDLSKELVRTAQGASGPGGVQAGSLHTARYPFLIMVPPGDVDTHEKLDVVRSIGDMARKMEKRITQVKVLYRDTSQHVRVAASDGTRVEDKRTQLVADPACGGRRGRGPANRLRGDRRVLRLRVSHRGTDRDVCQGDRGEVVRAAGRMRGTHGYEDGSARVRGRGHHDTRGHRPWPGGGPCHGRAFLLQGDARPIDSEPPRQHR